MIVFKERIKESEEIREVDQKEINFKERQVKILGLELKQERSKNEIMRNETKELLESCLDVKLLFERLDLKI